MTSRNRASETATHEDPRHVLDQAGTLAGVAVEGAELIRDGSNVLYSTPAGVVARIGPPGSVELARHQLDAARWLRDAGIRVVTALGGVSQPTLVDDVPVTWWNYIPSHRHATPAELGAALAQLHQLPVPDDLDLQVLDPFDGLDQSMENQPILSPQDRVWLRDRLTSLRAEYVAVRPYLTTGVIHGDAWQGNVVVPYDGSGPVLLDLDHIGVGPRDWDLVPLAVDHTDFARISSADYRDFVTALGGYDVTTSPGYDVLAVITEMRWTAFAIRKAGTDPGAAEQVRHRLACLKGEVPKPWTWTAL